MLTTYDRPEVAIAYTLLRHKGKAIAFLFLSVAVTVAAAVFLPKTYRSESVLLVRLGRENAKPDAVTTMGEESSPAVALQTREFEINSAVAMLTSRVTLERVVAAIGPAVILGKAEWSPSAEKAVASEDSDSSSPWAGAFWATLTSGAQVSTRDKAIRALGKLVHVESPLRSSVILVSSTSRSPELAQAIVAELVKAYVEQYVHANRTQGAHEFLAKQTAELHANLVRSEDALRDLQNDTGIVSVEKDREKIVTQIGRLETGLLDAAAEEAVAEECVKILRQRLAELPATEVITETTAHSKAAANMRQQLYELELQEKRLLASAKQAYFQVPQMQDQIREGQALLDRQPHEVEVTKGPSRRHEDVSLMLLRQEPVLASLHGKTALLQAQLAALRAESRAFNEKELRVRRLRRECELQEIAYRKYVASLDQARIDQALENERITSVNIIQPATFDSRPVGSPRLILAVGLLAGVSGALGLTLLAEYLDRTLRTSQDIEQQMGLKVLATIPRLKPRSVSKIA